MILPESGRWELAAVQMQQAAKCAKFAIRMLSGLDGAELPLAGISAAVHAAQEAERVILTILRTQTTAAAVKAESDRGQPPPAPPTAKVG